MSLRCSARSPRPDQITRQPRSVYRACASCRTMSSGLLDAVCRHLRARRGCAGARRLQKLALVTPAALLKLGLSPAAKVLDLAMPFGAADAERGGEPSLDQVGASERLTFTSRDNQHAPRAGLGELGYGSTTAANEVAPQIAAQSPRDESEIRIKDARVSARSSETGVSNGSGGSLQSGREKPPRNRILLSTRMKSDAWYPRRRSAPGGKPSFAPDFCVS
jgi:hypothetical protein